MTEETKTKKAKKANARYVREYKAKRDRVELYLPKGDRDRLRASIAKSGRHANLQEWFNEIVARRLSKS